MKETSFSPPMILDHLSRVTRSKASLTPLVHGKMYAMPLSKDDKRWDGKNCIFMGGYGSVDSSIINVSLHLFAGSKKLIYYWNSHCATQNYSK